MVDPFDLIWKEEEKGLMKIRAPTLTSQRVTVPSTRITSPATLYNNTLRFAIVLFHGDGDPSVTLSVTRGSDVFTLYGNEQAIEIVANETLRIDASGNGATPTIEILVLSW